VGDILEDMARIIQKELDDNREGYTPAVLAQHIVNQLRENNPELLRRWLSYNAVAFIREALNDRARRLKASNRKASSTRSVFREAMKEYEKGGPEAKPRLTRFLDETYRTEDGTSKPLRKMRRADLRYAAGEYRRQAKEVTMRRMFLEALAEKLGETDQQIGEVYTEEQLELMWRSLT
jgi:hypothetical protein